MLICTEYNVVHVKHLINPFLDGGGKMHIVDSYPVLAIITNLIVV